MKESYRAAEEMIQEGRVKKIRKHLREEEQNQEDYCEHSYRIDDTGGKSEEKKILQKKSRIKRTTADRAAEEMTQEARAKKRRKHLAEEEQSNEDYRPGGF